ncbi:MAG: YadA-like family protein [Polaromonas sp.]|nr:YadA-like family protein [Polaromonas sp.]
MQCHQWLGAVGETTVSAGVGSSGGQSALAVGLASRITGKSDF